MVAYLESSALVAWLLDEPAAEPVVAVLRTAEAVFCSRLTLLESRRAVSRLFATNSAAADRHRANIQRVAVGWSVIDISDAVAARAEAVFPVEPVRSLDAIHLATVQLLREQGAEMTLLSTDQRVRANAIALGIPVLP